MPLGVALPRDADNKSQLFVRAPVTALQLKPTPSRHRFEKPIHNVKELRSSDRGYRCSRSGSRFFIPGYLGQVAPPRAVSRSKAAPCGALLGAGRPGSHVD
jgi:hypothetical protein